MNYPTTIKCTNGSIARLESHEKWYIPTSVGGHKYDHEVDWTLYPERHRDRLRTLSEELLMVIHPRTFVNTTHALIWVFKYLSYLEAEDKYFDELTQVEWAGFDEFLMRNSLKLNSRRAYVSYLKTVLRTASNKRLDGIQPASLERITRGTKRRFRDANKLSMEKSSKRALSESEADNLYGIVKEEWLAWEMWSIGDKLSWPPDLLTIVVVMLCWDEGVRPEEINTLSVENVNIDTGRIIVKAPNKRSGYIHLSERNRKMLEAVVHWGEVARTELETDYIFVHPYGPVCIYSNEFNRAIEGLLVKYYHKYPIDRKLRLSDGRKTLGAAMASETQSRGMVSRILRHADESTAQIYYINQGKAQLSKNVNKALGQYSSRVYNAYFKAAVDPVVENPEVADMLRKNPDYENDLGACARDIDEEPTCSKNHCGRCIKLIPLVSKRENWVAERDFYLDLADETTYEKTRDLRLEHANMCQQYIDLIDDRIRRGA